MSLFDKISRALKEALAAKESNDFIKQLQAEKQLYDTLKTAGFAIVVEDPQLKARTQPYGVLTTVQKIDTVGTLTLLEEITHLEEITKIDQIDPDPNAQLLINGDFETGVISPWIGNMTISTQFAHGGIYSVYGANAEIQQILATPTPVSNIVQLTFWTLSPFGLSGSAYVRVIYSDATYTDITITKNADWAQTTVLPAALSSGKTISSVYFFNSYESPMWIDDVSLTTIYHTVIDLVREIAKMPSIIISSLPAVDVTDRAPRLLGHTTIDNFPTDYFKAGQNIGNLFALETGGNLASILAKLDVPLSTRFKPTDSIGNTSFGATQSARTSLKVMPEREDLSFKNFSNTFGAAGDYELLAAVSGQKHKVYALNYESSADIEVKLRDGTSSTIGFAVRTTKGVFAQTFIHPFLGSVNTALNLRAEGITTVKGYIQYKTEA